MTIWRETKPVATDPLSEFVSIMTAQAVAFREGVEKHSFWTDTSGASAGIPRLSDGSFGPGAARAFFDVQSNLSSQLSVVKPLDGRFYIASDTSRLFGYLSGATVLLGTKNAIVYIGASQATIPSNVRVLVQTGTKGGVQNGGSDLVTYPIAYAVAPTVQITAQSSGTTIIGQTSLGVPGVSTFTCAVQTLFGTAGSQYTILWRSHGTATL